MKTTFRLYKRRDDGSEMKPEEPGFRERFYYFRFTYRGKAYVRNLETNDATEAQRRARQKYVTIVSAVSSKAFNRLESTKLRRTAVVPLSTYLTAYKSAPGPDNASPDPNISTRLRSSTQTRIRNCAALLNLLGQVFDQNQSQLLDQAASELINSQTARRWFARFAAADRAAKVTANSLFTQAASVFQPLAVEIYDQLNLPIHEFKGFVAARVHSFGKSDLGEEHYELPSAEVIGATLQAWRQLGQDGTQRNLYLAIGHELAFGLRAGEISQARWSWWQTKFETPMLVATGKFKHNRLGKFEVPALDPWFSEMASAIEKHQWKGQPDDYILTGTECHRTDEIFRQASEWLRNLGWQTSKTNHALRAWAGCQVAIRYSLFDTQRFLRHSNIQVTQKHYLYLLNGPHMEYLKRTCESKWASLAQPTDATLDATVKSRPESSTVLDGKFWTLPHHRN